MRQATRDKIARKMARDPHCHWCGRELVWFDPGPKCKFFPPDFATLDHLNSRVERKPRPARGRLVLACRECNERRAAEEERALGIEELRRRAGHAGRGCADGT